MNDEGFRIDSPEKASVVMRKYRKLAQRKARNERLAQSEHDRIDRWLSGLSASVDSQMEFLEAHLSAYAIGERANGIKSVPLPDGTIRTKQVGVTFDVDKAVFLDWAQTEKRDDLMRVTYAPDMPAIKNSVIADGSQAIDPLSGEVIPGLQPVPERLSVTIVPDLEAIDLEGMDEEGIDDVE